MPAQDGVGGGILTGIHRFWAAAAATIVLDLASKSLVFDALGEPPPPGQEHVGSSAVWILPRAVRLVCHYNTGGAFGLASGNLLLFLAAAAALIPALILAAYHCRDPRAPIWSLGLVVGGALGNLYDRLIHIGVRDFFEVVNPRTGYPLWPVFNVADIAIVFGVAVYLVWTLIDSAREKRRARIAGETADPADDRPSR